MTSAYSEHNAQMATLKQLLKKKQGGEETPEQRETQRSVR
jgi:hypothetical protein